jgi:hypothetical protein
MCVDYTNLNKACPKDPFPLPRIDQIVDFTSGCGILSFLDAYSGYHQITTERVRPTRDFFHHPIWHVPLHHHAVWPKKCWRHLPALHVEMFRRSDQSA